MNNHTNEISHNYEIRFLWRGKKAGSTTKTFGKEKSKDAEDFDDENYYLCSACKNPIVQKNDRINVNEKNEHFFANPHGYVFHIGCFSRAAGCIIYGDESSYFSWFNGYTWRIALCGQCGILMGWFFRSKEFQFFGIILDNIN